MSARGGTWDESEESTDLRVRRRVELRAHVVRVATALFRERGYEPVTVDEIAQAAGVSKRTLFRHFSSKEEILLGNARQLGQELARLDLAAMDAPAVLGAVEDIYAAMLERMVADQTALQVQQVIGQSERLRQAAHSLHRELMDDLRIHLAQTGGPDGGLIGRLVIEISTGTLHAALDEWVGATGHEMDLRQLYQRARAQARQLLR
ncbi:TetR/AcrR family transcriptional regulator [Kineococcus sp. SYSU DK006]|uniref:TetR/AcrR family transcriptional regulator n=1 Tax=Kineococcus sp. SYSU DK006 TaxID=3383127 RepID=UPI003D7E233B